MTNESTPASQDCNVCQRYECLCNVLSRSPSPARSDIGQGQQFYGKAITADDIASFDEIAKEVAAQPARSDMPDTERIAELEAGLQKAQEGLLTASDEIAARDRRIQELLAERTPSSAIDITAERIKFEAAMRAEGKCSAPTRADNGEYWSDKVEQHWQGWLVARRATAGTGQPAPSEALRVMRALIEDVAANPKSPEGYIRLCLAHFERATAGTEEIAPSSEKDAFNEAYRAYGHAVHWDRSDGACSHHWSHLAGHIWREARRATAGTTAPEKPFAGPGAWFSVDVLGNPMRQYAPGKWENCVWPSSVAGTTAAPADVCAEMRALCSACGGTGDVVSIDGEWRGECDCEASAWARVAGTTAPAAPLSSLAIEKIVQLIDEHTDRDFGLIVEPFARAVEREVKAGIAAPDSLYQSARNLAAAIWRDNYKDTTPQWEPLDDLAGVLSQIDNMVCGMKRVAGTTLPTESKAGEGGASALRAEPAGQHEASGPVLSKEEIDSLAEGYDLYSIQDGGRINRGDFLSLIRDVEKMVVARCRVEGGVTCNKGTPDLAGTTATAPSGDGCKFCLGAKGGVPGNANRIGGEVVCDYCTALLMHIKESEQKNPSGSLFRFATAGNAAPDRPNNFGQEVTRLVNEIRKPISMAWRDSLVEQLIELIDPTPDGIARAATDAPGDLLRYDCVLTPEGKAEMYASENGAYVWYDHVAPFLASNAGAPLDAEKLGLMGYCHTMNVGKFITDDREAAVWMEPRSAYPNGPKEGEWMHPVYVGKPFPAAPSNSPVGAQEPK